ncbi:MAG: hypothetical protein WCA27_04895 [Candidatus Sulfotelmatobacter sp.]
MNNANFASNSKQCRAQSACALCEGIFAHESWCASRDPGASYAYQIIVDASRITPGDSLILHSLGVAWAESVPNAV